MTTTTTTLLDQMLRFSPEETRAFFDAQARKLLGISGAEFIRRRDAGELTASDDEMRARIAYLTTLSAVGACTTDESDDVGNDEAERGPIPENGFPIVELTPEESRAYFDAEARHLLGLSGEEFLRRWDAGEYEDVFDTPGNWAVTHLGMLANFGR